MPPNQSPLAGILNLFKGGNPTPTPPTRGLPGFGGGPGGFPGFPGAGGGGFPGSGGLPGGSGMGAAKSGGLFGIGDIFKNLGKVDFGKVMDGVNNFRNMMANAQKVATTLNQLGITIGNVQKFMKQVDVNGLMNLLGSGEGDSSSEPTDEEPVFTPTPKVTRKRTTKRSSRKKTRKKRNSVKKKRVPTRVTKQKSRTSKPLYKNPT